MCFPSDYVAPALLQHPRYTFCILSFFALSDFVLLIFSLVLLLNISETLDTGQCLLVSQTKISIDVELHDVTLGKMVPD